MIVLAYVETKKKVLKYIKTKGIKIGDKLPSENKLSAELGISRLTLREALNALKQEGIVNSVQGKGTFITCSPEQISDTLNNNLGISEMIEASGYTPGVMMFEKKLVKADAEVAARLNVVQGTDLILCKRTRTADNKPVVISEDYLAPKLSQEFLSITDENVSLYNFLEDTVKEKIGVSIAEIDPICATEELAESLDLKVGSPLLSMKVTVSNSFGVPLIYAREYLKPESFKFLIYRWR